VESNDTPFVEPERATCEGCTDHSRTDCEKAGRCEYPEPEPCTNDEPCNTEGCVGCAPVVEPGGVTDATHQSTSSNCGVTIPCKGCPDHGLPCLWCPAVDEGQTDA
jgi:hypothetical protein